MPYLSSNTRYITPIQIIGFLALAVFLTPGVNVRGETVRESGGIYTDARIKTVRENCTRHEWAKKLKNNAVEQAKFWVAKSDEELWALVPGQGLPRTIDVTWDYDFPASARLGCLKCGEKLFQHGNYPYEPDFWKAPWKLKCPSCGVVFPTNDFGKFYQSGMDDRGLFDPAKADRKLLFNADHPDPADPLHKFGVDDGLGFVDSNGREHKFIGYYAWKFWREIMRGLQTLTDAYLYTGDKIYAQKAAILLDRIADVYPEMDWAPYAARGWYHSDGTDRIGKIEGRIWETNLVQQLAMSYEKIFTGVKDNAPLYQFLSKQGSRYKTPLPKGTFEQLVKNIDDGVLRCAADAIKSGQVSGNEGMHQYSMAVCAIALNNKPETDALLDWIFSASGGKFPQLILGSFDRDGVADEAAPGYCLLWPDKFAGVGDLIDLYGKYDHHNLYKDYPVYQNAFRAPARLAVLYAGVPNIGDTGATGQISLAGINARLVVKGFKVYGDELAAAAAFKLNGNSADRLAQDVFDPTPDKTAARIKEAAEKHPDPFASGENMAGYGLATAEFGETSSGKALWCYYGRTTKHGHLDHLNFGLWAFGCDLSPDHGYPEFANSTWANRRLWTVNTLSHNTVMVNDEPQRKLYDGSPLFYVKSDGLYAWEIDGRNAYKSAEQYQRAMCFAETPDGNAYAVDWFRVSGGKSHLYSFHGPPGTVATDGLALVKQSTGTLAGADVPFAAEASSIPKGFSYLYDVEKTAQPAGLFQATWKAEDGYRGLKKDANLFIKMHSLADCDSVALADGDPPQNKAGNPRRLRYALLRREGDNLKSLFAAVYEPYKQKPFIKTVDKLTCNPPQGCEAGAVRIALVSGEEDYLISNPAGTTVTLNNGLSTDARFAFLRLRNGKPAKALMVAGTSLAKEDWTLSGTAELSGRLVKFHKDAKGPANAWLEMNDPACAVAAGQQVIFQNHGDRNAFYDVKSAEKEGNLWKVETTAASFVNGFQDEKDYEQGFSYNVAEGNLFTIPLVTQWNASSEKATATK